MIRKNAKGLCIYISASKKDEELALKIQERLVQEGHECVLYKKPETDIGGYRKTINLLLDPCSVFIECLSGSYLHSEMNEYEREKAVGWNLDIVPVLLDDLDGVDLEGFQELSNLEAQTIRKDDCLEKGKEDMETLMDAITDFPAVKRLKEERESLKAKSQKPAAMSDKLRQRLREFYKDELSPSTALTPITPELFAPIRDKESGILYVGEGEDISLLKYLRGIKLNNKDHVILTGQSGTGKTVSLKTVAQYYFEHGKCPIYIPAGFLSRKYSFEEYVGDIVLGGDEELASELKSMIIEERPENASVIFIIDGVDEVSEEGFIPELLDRIKQDYFKSQAGVHFLISGGRAGIEITADLLKDFCLLQMEPLSQSVVEKLVSTGDKAQSHLVKEPLHISLLMEQERLRRKYGDEGLNLQPEFNVKGVIIENFLRGRIFEATIWEDISVPEKEALGNLLLPLVANAIENKPQSVLSEFEMEGILEQVSVVIDGVEEVGKSARELLDFAVEKLAILSKRHGFYSFSHSVLERFFYVNYFASQLKRLHKNPELFDELSPLLEDRKMSLIELRILSILLNEREARPYTTEDGIVFPGKDGLKASENSIAEQMLSLWKGKEGPKAQTAVANLLGIMSMGRNKRLGMVDLSNLDLRGSEMNGSIFVEWHEDNYYPSKFDGSFIDKNFFLTEGHRSNVTSLATDPKGGRVFSGDANGFVRVYDAEGGAWVQELSPFLDKVADLSYNQACDSLAILYADRVFVYSFGEGRYTFEWILDEPVQSYRYVKLDDTGKPRVSRFTEPLTWIDPVSRKRATDLTEDFPAGAAARSPRGNVIVRSLPTHLLSIKTLDRKGRWRDHPIIGNLKKEAKKNAKKFRAVQDSLLNLSEFGLNGKGGINAVRFSPSGDRFLVALGEQALEFETESLKLLNTRRFEGPILDVAYLNGDAVIAQSKGFTILNSNFNKKNLISGEQNSRIRGLWIHPDRETLFIQSSNGEIKEMDKQLNVIRVRQCGANSGFAWIRDAKTKKAEMLLLPPAGETEPIRYDFERDLAKPLGWGYSFVEDTMERLLSGGHLYRHESILEKIEDDPPYEVRELRNYRGVYIFNCSFKDIKGDLSQEENRVLLEQNGAVLE